MKTKKLFELLTLVNGVDSNRWQTVMSIVECFNNSHVEVIKKEWTDEYKQDKPEYYPLDLSNIKIWSTYDNCGCININFTNKDDQLYCKVLIYNGESFGGRRTGLRFEAELILPDNFIHNLEGTIDWAFKEFLDEAYETHLAVQKEIWINKMKTEILEK